MVICLNYIQMIHINLMLEHIYQQSVYKTLSNDDPTKITYYGGLSESTAKKFQQIAKEVC